MTGQEDKVLDLLRTHLITTEGRLHDHVATTFRWLMATLFAANGGAILALFGAAQHRVQASTTALSWFGAGVLPRRRDAERRAYLVGMRLIIEPRRGFPTAV